MALPVMLYQVGVPRPNRVYSALPTAPGPFAFFHKVIFEEKGDIDVLFLGSSLSWNSIDASMVKTELSKKLGREAIVYNFGSNWRGENLYYSLLRDLTERRRVKLLLFNMPMPYQQRNEPHEKTQFLTLYAPDQQALEGLSFFRKVQNFAFQVLGAPRHLVGLLREDKPIDVLKSGASYGSLITRSGMNNSQFIEQNIAPPYFAPSDLIYSEKTRGNYTFKGPDLGDYQAHYVRKILDLAQSKSIAIATFYIPVFKQRHQTTIEERACWPDIMGNPAISMLGIPSAVLFKDLSEEQITNMYYDNNHMNVNGAQFYSRALLPGIIELYDRAVAK